MCLRFVFLLTTRAASWLRLSRREETWKTAEILILRHQLAVLQRRQTCRPNLNWAYRPLLVTLLSGIPKARRQGLRLLVTPDTILRWHRDIIRRRWAARSMQGKPGRPATRQNIRALVCRLARENPDWDTAGSMASSPAWGLRSQRPPSGRSSRPAASTPADGRPGDLVTIPALPGRGDPGVRLLHGRSAQRHPGLRPGRNRARDPAHPHPRHHPPSHRRMDRPAGPKPPHGP